MTQTTEECWRITPLLVRSSMPLHPPHEKEAPAVTVLQEEHEAPTSGSRKRPGAADEPHAEVLPYPSDHADLLVRHDPGAVLQQRKKT
eukprot:scaffold3.g6477.t1